MATKTKRLQLQSVGVIGGGAWGTALAQCLCAAGRDVLLWARDPSVVADINARHENGKRLPGIKLDVRLRATGALGEAAVADVLLLAAPAQHLRASALLLKPHLRRDTQLVICAKGIEQGTELPMSGVAFEVTGSMNLAVLSGPSFAKDVALGLPTAVVLAAPDMKMASQLAAVIGHRNFRIYASTDVIGVQTGGAVKNVLAIAAGIVAGRQLGASAQAALVTRAFHELTEFGRKCGAKPATLTGLSGLGDLMLTCNSPQSRNFAFGRHLGEGQSVSQALEAVRGTVEGVYTANVVDRVAREGKPVVEMPIAAAVHGILRGALSVDAAIDELLSRPQKAES